MHSTVSLDFKRENYSHFPYKTACNKIGQDKVDVGIIHFTRLCVVINLVIKVMELKITSFMRNFQALWGVHLLIFRLNLCECDVSKKYTEKLDNAIKNI